MSRVIFFAFLITVIIPFSSFGANKEMVTHKISNSAVSIHSLDGVTEVSKKFDKKEPLNSYLELELSATVEGNTCGYSKFSLQQIHKPSKRNNIEKSHLKFIPLKENKKTIPVEDEICTMESTSKEIAARLRLSLNMMDETQKTKRWEYIIKDDNKVAGRIRVNYSTQKGWIFKLKK